MRNPILLAERDGRDVFNHWIVFPPNHIEDPFDELRSVYRDVEKDEEWNYDDIKEVLVADGWIVTSVITFWEDDG